MFSVQVQNIANTQNDCHRIVVVLNEEIVTDEWKLHQVYTVRFRHVERISRKLLVKSLHVYDVSL